MESHHKPGRARLFALVDGAAAPGPLPALLERAGVECRNVYEGLPEAASGAASLFLVSMQHRHQTASASCVRCTPFFAAAACSSISR